MATYKSIGKEFVRLYLEGKEKTGNKMLCPYCGKEIPVHVGKELVYKLGFEPVELYSAYCDSCMITYKSEWLGSLTRGYSG